MPYSVLEYAVFHELHHHLIWLIDASGHAGAIHDRLDGVEKRLREKSHAFTKHFDQFYLNELEEMELSAEMLGTFTASMADHTAREEQYYLIKLTQSSK